MTCSNTAQFACDADTTQSDSCCPMPRTNTTCDLAQKQKTKDRVIGLKPNFENGYVTMNEDGLAIAMIPKQTEAVE